MYIYTYTYIYTYIDTHMHNQYTETEGVGGKGGKRETCLKAVSFE
jgi:hypothetical protein